MRPTGAARAWTPGRTSLNATHLVQVVCHHDHGDRCRSLNLPLVTSSRCRLLPKRPSAAAVLAITLLTHSLADARPGPGPVSQWYQAACFCWTPSLRSRISAECGSVFSASVCVRECACACVHARASPRGVGVCARTGASGARLSLLIHMRS